jgi:hypothetical protein
LALLCCGFMVSSEGFCEDLVGKMRVGETPFEILFAYDLLS